jgi:NAD(P)-dependent dehydrogenase (short-subunit alcohol dehydrogenase family)
VVTHDKVCLIVGAGDYIGAAIARRFAAGGYTVCLGRRNGDKNERWSKRFKRLAAALTAFRLMPAKNSR